MSMTLYRQTDKGDHYECQHCGEEVVTKRGAGDPGCPSVANHDEVDDGWDLDDGFVD